MNVICVEKPRVGCGLSLNIRKTHGTNPVTNKCEKTFHHTSNFLLHQQTHSEFQESNDQKSNKSNEFTKAKTL